MARKHTEAELLHFIVLYLYGVSYQTLVRGYILEFSRITFMRYVRKYQLYGIKGLIFQKKSFRYTNDFK